MGVSEGISQFNFYRFQLKGPQGKGELPLGVGLALLALQQVARAPGLELEVRLEGHPGVPALLLVEAQNQRAAVTIAYFLLLTIIYSSKYLSFMFAHAARPAPHAVCLLISP